MNKKILLLSLLTVLSGNVLADNIPTWEEVYAKHDHNVASAREEWLSILEKHPEAQNIAPETPIRFRGAKNFFRNAGSKIAGGARYAGSTAKSGFTYLNPVARAIASFGNANDARKALFSGEFKQAGKQAGLAVVNGAASYGLAMYVYPYIAAKLALGSRLGSAGSYLGSKLGSAGSYLGSTRAVKYAATSLGSAGSYLGSKLGSAGSYLASTRAGEVLRIALNKEAIARTPWFRKFIHAFFHLADIPLTSAV